MLKYLQDLLNSGSTFVVDLTVNLEDDYVGTRKLAGVQAVDAFGLVIDPVEEHMDAICIPWSAIATLRVTIAEDKRATPFLGGGL